MSKIEPHSAKRKPGIPRFFGRGEFALETNSALSRKLRDIYVALDNDAATTSDQMECYYEHADKIRAVLEPGYIDVRDAKTDAQAKKLAIKLRRRIGAMIADYKREAKQEPNKIELHRLAKQQIPVLANRDDFIIVNGCVWFGDDTPLTPEEQAESDRYWAARKQSRHATLEEFHQAFEASEELRRKNVKPATNGNGKHHDFDTRLPDEIIQDRIDDWRDPVDLWGKLDPPELPRGLAPKVIEDYAFTQGATMGCDPGGVAMAALAVCAGVTTDAIKLKMKKYSDDWMESARIWVALVGDPSSKKSPIRSVTNKPINKLEAELLRIFNQEMAEWNALSPEEKATTPKPTRMRYVMDDYTLESMQDVLNVNPPGILLSVDEGSGWIGGLDKYSGGKGGASKDRGAALSGFNGGQYPVDRVQRGSFLIPNWGYSLLCGIQPSVMRKLASDSYDDGFLQRMLIIVLREATLGKDEPTPPIAATYEKLVRQLSELRPPPPDKWNIGEHGTLRFDPEAQELRNEMEKRHHDLMRLQLVNKKLAGHIGKYDGYFGKLCVLFHCIEHAHDKVLPSIVTIDTAQRVADFMHKFLLPHALAFFAGILGLSDQHDELTAIAGFVLAHRKQAMTYRDAQRGSRVMRGLKKREVTELYEQFETLGWFKREVDRRGRVLHWTVNPKVHDMFTDRAKREKESRNATHELILQAVAARRDGQT